MIKGVRDNVYILPLQDREMTQSGLLYIPETNKQRCDQGIIKYRGPDVKELKVGMHVLFSGWDGSQVVTEDDGLMFVMPESFIQAIVADDVPLYLFTQPQITAFLKKASGDLRLRHPELSALLLTEHISRFEHYVLNHFYAELQF